MSYLKIPHTKAENILSLYEASDDICTLAKQYIDPASLIQAATDAELFNDVVLFIAHALPVREAVWWACCCTATRDNWNDDEANAIRSAKAWVHTPDETSRRFAEQMAIKADLQSGAGWVAQAAFWSGGSMTGIDAPVVPPPEHLYSHAVAGAINLSAVMPDGTDAEKRYQHYLAMGLNIAQGGNGQIGE
ncbi:Twin-arginine translocation pathway signal [uncultured Photobacterium sp.]|uniref:DUF6931 family protein n=1 Tax=uncultured Photobacterium sp. TaxID=173973 RepID=UPI002609802C|nr:Twin-arginine translocation pathway signal [uncultured Photobacterium sp.]